MPKDGDKSSYRLALDPPAGDVVRLTHALVDEARAYSQTSPRRRVIVPFHKTAADHLNRMFNVVQPDSYIRPHRHLDPAKAEGWVVLRGSLVFFAFAEDGTITEAIFVAPEAPTFGIDLGPGIFHSFIATSPDTVIYEVKAGPYVAAADKDFPAWAPPEHTPEAGAYLASLRAAAQARGLLPPGTRP